MREENAKERQQAFEQDAGQPRTSRRRPRERLEMAAPSFGRDLADTTGAAAPPCRLQALYDSLSGRSEEKESDELMAGRTAIRGNHH